MSQSLNGIRQLLQQKIFNHPCVKQYNSYSQAVLYRLGNCHTAQIGVHQFICNNGSCGHVHYQYHSCGNRHCPNCGGMRREQWIQDRMSELLPTRYYHVVFTLPQELRSVCMGNRIAMFNLLFEAAHYTLQKLGKDPKYLGGKAGIVSVLHTHGQDLSFHPHIHCIVSGGGIGADGKWIKEKRVNGNFLFPRRSMEKIYKGYVMMRMRKMITGKKIIISDAQEIATMLHQIGYKKWNVYAKAPFGGPAQIIEYLGRYTHKVAITAHRIASIDDTHITFNYKDYQDGNKQKQMRLTHGEFLRRFEQHILPQRFVKIRHAGYMSHQGKNERIAAICQQLQLPAPMPKVQVPIAIQVLQHIGTDIGLCPVCKTGHLQLTASYLYHNGAMVNIADLRNRGSPKTTRLPATAACG